MTINYHRAIFLILFETIIFFTHVIAGQCAFGKQDCRMRMITPPNGAAIMKEKVHFVIAVSHLQTANAKLVVRHNPPSLKKICLTAKEQWWDKDAHISPTYYFHFSLVLDIGPNTNRINLCLIDNIGHLLDEIDLNLLCGRGEGAEIINVGNSPIIWYKTRVSSTKPKELLNAKFQSDYTFHTKENEKECLKCHEFDAQPIEKNDPTPSSCVTCHKDFFQGENLHPTKMKPFNCLECHKKRQGASGYAFTPLNSETCLSCHQDRIAKYLHGPLEAGECRICHQPHAGEERYRLRRKVNLLCTGCHAGKHYGKILAAGHPILPSMNDARFGGREYNCTGCHDPHGSNSNNYLLLRDTKGPDEPCRRCHPHYF